MKIFYNKTYYPLLYILCMYRPDPTEVLQEKKKAGSPKKFPEVEERSRKKLSELYWG